MKRVLTIVTIITIIILTATVYNYSKLSNSIDEGLKKYNPEKTLEATKEKYPIIVMYAEDSTPKAFLNFLYYHLQRNVPYNYERAGDPEVFLSRGGDCYDFTYYIIGLYVALYGDADIYLLIMNIETEQGITGHIAPVFKIGDEYILVDAAAAQIAIMGDLHDVQEYYNIKKITVFHLLFEDKKLTRKTLVLDF